MVRTESELHLNKCAKAFIFLSTVKDECLNFECHSDKLVLVCSMVGLTGRLGSVESVSEIETHDYQLPVECRDVAALTISYEAQARLANPVHGCVSSIIALQQVQPEPVQHLESQPIGSPALTNNTMNDSSLPNAVDYHNHAHPHPSIDPFQLSRSQSQNGDNDEENQDFVVFLDHILQSG
ncbi:LOB domain-containing protein 29-like protein [Tanacetum coccineum]